MKNLIRYSFFVITFALLSPSFSVAEEEVVERQHNTKFSIGVAFINGASIYSSESSKSRLIPYLSYETKKIRVSVQEGLTYQLISTPKVSFDASISPNFKPYEAKDSQSLNGMRRKMTFDGSLSTSYRLERGLTAKVDLSTEVSNEFSGSAAIISISQFIPILGVPVIFQAGSAWYDKDRAKYFYGVYDTEATALRPQYDPGSVFVPYLSLNSFYSLTSATSLFAIINTTMLPEKVLNSPIVKRENSLNMIVGVGYKF